MPALGSHAVGMSSYTHGCELEAVTRRGADRDGCRRSQKERAGGHRRSFHLSQRLRGGRGRGVRSGSIDPAGWCAASRRSCACAAARGGRLADWHRELGARRLRLFTGAGRPASAAGRFTGIARAIAPSGPRVAELAVLAGRGRAWGMARRDEAIRARVDGPAGPARWALVEGAGGLGWAGGGSGRGSWQRASPGAHRRPRAAPTPFALRCRSTPAMPLVGSPQAAPALNFPISRCLGRAQLPRPLPPARPPSTPPPSSPSAPRRAGPF